MKNGKQARLDCLAFKNIILTTINAKWIHPSLALRLLKANLGSLEDSCEIIEFALRQPLSEKLDQLRGVFKNDLDNGKPGAACSGSRRTGILGISVSIWNHTATIELLKELEKSWSVWQIEKPIIVLGGPEVTHLPPAAEIFNYADYVIRGEGEAAFKSLCEYLLDNKNLSRAAEKFISEQNVNLTEIKTAYHLYTDEDISKKLIYVESSRGCPFGCEFCMSAEDNKVREFPLEKFLAEMDILIQRGVKTFKFLDRSFNTNIKRALQIINFFLDKIEQLSAPPRLCESSSPFTVHFEMVPSVFPAELREALARFPPGTLRLEIGIQTLNEETAARIGRHSNPEKELEALRFLREKTNAIIHADLIAGLPGEDLASFGSGFDRLWDAVFDDRRIVNPSEIQLGILKLLPGAPISRHNEVYNMRYNPLPPYEVEETLNISAVDLGRIKNFARFWELIVNRGLLTMTKKPIFEKFMTLSDNLFAYFGKNWGIDREKLKNKAVTCINSLVF